MKSSVLRISSRVFHSAGSLCRFGLFFLTIMICLALPVHSAENVILQEEGESGSSGGLMIRAADKTQTGKSTRSKKKKTEKPTKYRGLVLRKGRLYYYTDQGYALKNKWIRIDQYMRRTDENGALRIGFWTVPKTGNTYYFDEQGRLKHGWQKIGAYYYYFLHGSGLMQKNKTVDRIALNRKGRAMINSSNSRYLATYVLARKIAEDLTHPKMSTTQRMWACFQWVMNKPYINRPGRLPFRNYSGFEIDNALDVLTGGGGTCFGDASGFAFLAHALGIKGVSVCTDTGHCWCDINGYIYDPLLYEGWHNTNYFGKIMTGGHHKAAVRVYIGS